MSKKYISEIVGAIPLAQEQLEVMVLLLKKSCPCLEKFLDIGCGNGFLSEVIMHNYPEAKGVLLDFSDVMLGAAKLKLGKNTDLVEFIKSDYADPSWVRDLGKAGEVEFNAVVSRLSIHHQPDDIKKSIYEQIYSIIKPGGIFVNIEHVSLSGDWGKKIFQDYMVDHLCKSRKVDKESRGRAEIKDDFISRHEKDSKVVASAEDQCDWLRKIGFVDVDCYFKIFEIAVIAGRKK